MHADAPAQLGQQYHPSHQSVQCRCASSAKRRQLGTWQAALIVEDLHERLLEKGTGIPTVSWLEGLTAAERVIVLQRRCDSIRSIISASAAQRNVFRGSLLIKGSI